MVQPFADFTSIRRELLFEQIVHTLDGMPEDLREVFVLRHYAGKSNAEIAALNGVGMAEVKSLVQSADQVFFRNLNDLED